MPELLVTDGPAKGRTFKVAEETVIGRSTRVDVHLKDSSVSQVHAQITCRRGVYYVADRGSTNGTEVNGKEYEAPRALEHGDVLTLGNSVMTFSDPPREISEQTVLHNIDVLKSMTLFQEDREDDQFVVAEVQTSDPVTGIQSTVSDEEEEAYQLRRYLDIFNKISTGLSQTIEEQKMLEIVLSTLFEALPNAGRGVLMVTSDGDGGLEPRVSKKRPWRDTLVPVSRTMIARAVETRKGILSLDPGEDDRFAESKSVHDLRMRSVVCVPLMVREEVYGLLQLDAAADRSPLSKQDLSLVAAVGGQVALALANRRLHSSLLEQELLQKDLQLARKIQQQFVSTSRASHGPFVFEQRYRPALEVGGDYYGYLPLAGGNLGIAVGDVSGKGIAAALYMARVSSEIRYLAAARTDPGLILWELNEALCGMASEGMFMTMALLSLQGERCTLASAGHLPPLVRRASGEVETIRSSVGLALGIDEDIDYPTHEIQLSPGDCLVLVTDGVTEAQAPGGEFLGDERLAKVLGSTAGKPKELADAVHDDVQRFEEGSSPTDDLTVLAMGRV